ncbi:hypothetical protein [Metabacillus arenae]|uniref:Uncharacterized protein n=1 Tax=Metabacillus arenae TaxID=2771434 RepID=A0A926NKH5_9BACI|nr:hypothetical protein [Metabacillus arenae]MBD1379506.1 hypothetical protein [Metabacillus arenae]
MSNIENNKQGTERKKISLQEAIKQKLASKQQKQSTEKASNDLVKTTKRLKSQHTKKTNNQRKRTGV